MIWPPTHFIWGNLPFTVFFFPLLRMEFSLLSGYVELSRQEGSSCGGCLCLCSGNIPGVYDRCRVGTHQKNLCSAVNRAHGLQFRAAVYTSSPTLQALFSGNSRLAQHCLFGSQCLADSFGVSTSLGLNAKERKATPFHPDHRISLAMESWPRDSVSQVLLLYDCNQACLQVPTGSH